MAKLDSHFMCPKEIKMMCAGRPRSEWRMFMEAHVAYLSFKKSAMKRKTKDLGEAV